MATKVWIACGLILVVLVAVIALRIGPSTDRHSETSGIVLTGARLDVPFVLMNQHEKPFKASDLKGKYHLIFFGFTFCPAVCPTELQKIAVIMHDLGPLADKVVPVFVTIDPERDTPTVLKTYLEQFDKRIIGLTGPAREIRKIADAYKVYYSKVGAGPDYTMDHSAFVYLVSPDGDLLSLYKPDQSAQDILSDLTPRL